MPKLKCKHCSAERDFSMDEIRWLKDHISTIDLDEIFIVEE